VMYDLAREANRLLGEKKLSKKGAENLASVLSRFNELFDVLQDREKVTHTITLTSDAVFALPDTETISPENLTDGEIKKWVELREAARKRKDFAYADRVRKKLAEIGIVIQDTQDGAVWKRK